MSQIDTATKDTIFKKFRNWETRIKGLEDRLGNFFSKEQFRAVGAAGQPAFSANWSNFGGAYAGLRFYKDGLGRVHITGAVKKSANTVAGEVIFTLPAGYRPSAALTFPGWTSTVSNISIDILADGSVKINQGGIAANSEISLGSINFRAEQ